MRKSRVTEDQTVKTLREPAAHQASETEYRADARTHHGEIAERPIVA